MLKTLIISAVFACISGCAISNVAFYGFPFELLDSLNGKSVERDHYRIELNMDGTQRVKVGEHILFLATVHDKDGKFVLPDSWNVIGNIGYIVGGDFYATTEGVGYVEVRKEGDSARCRVEVFK